MFKAYVVGIKKTSLHETVILNSHCICFKLGNRKCKINFRLKKKIVITIHGIYKELNIQNISQLSYYAWQEIFDNFSALVKFTVK